MNKNPKKKKKERKICIIEKKKDCANVGGVIKQRHEEKSEFSEQITCGD